MLQVDSNWSMTGSPEDLEREMIEFKFNGSGLYLTKTDTVLVLPLPQGPLDEIKAKTWKPDISTIWFPIQPEGTLWVAYVWNCNTNDMIFSQIAIAPVRQDER